MKTVFIFPGQGAQKPGMGKEMYDSSKKVRQFFHDCSDIVHKDLPKLLFESSTEELQNTDNTQIAITAVSLATALVLQEKGIEPAAVAGFSLGEYAALVLAGVLSVEEVFAVVQLRGAIMEESGKAMERQLQKSADSEEDAVLGMTAILGMHPDDIHARLEQWNIEHVHFAMYNSPVQGVIAGTKKAREQAAELLKQEGARRAVPLRVGSAFHTVLMREASERFAEAIRDVEFKNPHIPIYSNVSAERAASGDELKSLCIDQIISPVRWLHEEEAIWANESPERLFEVGPGTVLSGLWKQWKEGKDESEIPDVLTLETLEKMQDL